MSSTTIFGSTRTSFNRPACCRQVMKLIEKTRIGSKVKKKYDRARTPFQRVLESEFVPAQAKKALREEYAKLNPVKLKQEIIRLQGRLDILARSKNGAKQEERHVNLEYIFT